MPTFTECFKKAAVQAKRQNYSAGALVFSEGDRAQEMYFIESGQVKITRMVPKIHSEITLALLGREDFFGISALIGKPRMAKAIAVSDCTIWQVNEEAFYEAMTKNVEFARLVVKDLVKRLDGLQVKMSETTEQMVEFTRRVEDLTSIWHSMVTWG